MVYSWISNDGPICWVHEWLLFHKKEVYKSVCDQFDCDDNWDSSLKFWVLQHSRSKLQSEWSWNVYHWGTNWWILLHVLYAWFISNCSLSLCLWSKMYPWNSARICIWGCKPYEFCCLWEHLLFSCIKFYSPKHFNSYFSCPEYSMSDLHGLLRNKVQQSSMSKPQDRLICPNVWRWNRIWRRWDYWSRRKDQSFRLLSKPKH